MKAFCRKIYTGRRRLAIMDLASITRQEVERVLDENVKATLVKEHREIVEDWESDVDFSARKVIKPDSIAIYVFPTGKDKMVWIYVDQGTKEHDIPKGGTMPPGKYLWFQWGGRGSYTPKTLPGATVVQGGGYVRNAHLVRMKGVHHPGTDPRKFSEAIAENNKPYFTRMTELAFRRAAWRANGK